VHPVTYDSLVKNEIERYPVGKARRQPVGLFFGDQAGVQVHHELGRRLDLPDRFDVGKERHLAMFVAAPAEQEPGAPGRTDDIGQGQQLIRAVDGGHAFQEAPLAVFAQELALGAGHGEGREGLSGPVHGDGPHDWRMRYRPKALLGEPRSSPEATPMKAFQVTGSYDASRVGYRKSMQNFSVQVAAVDENAAKEKVLSDLGSKHRKRREEINAPDR